MRFGALLFFLAALIASCPAQDTNFAMGPQYLMTSGSPLFARPIATPSLSLGEVRQSSTYEEPSVASADAATYSTTPGLPGQADLFPVYYGVPRVSVIEMTGPEASPSVLPASRTNAGVTEATDLPSLRMRGFGVTLPEASSYWKAHKRSASRVYTNRDIERLHGGS
jgi:hypothetical protein